ncbi:hypothetical protein V2O64_13590 [Verrucomicrobiaceae bacterium 227]
MSSQILVAVTSKKQNTLKVANAAWNYIYGMRGRRFESDPGHQFTAR